ncbi:MAG: polysaccharide deacetylase family protein [Thermoanaerobacteraceae bacterium]
MIRKKRSKKNKLLYTITTIFLLLIIICSGVFTYIYFNNNYIKTTVANTIDKNKEQTPISADLIPPKKIKNTNSSENSSLKDSNNTFVSKEDNKINVNNNKNSLEEKPEQNSISNNNETNISENTNNTDYSNYIINLVQRPEKDDLFGPPIPFHLKVFGFNNNAGKVVALTFDDGPSYEYTQKYVDILKSLDIKATFFVIGKNAEKYPKLLKYISENGNEIGLHSYSHFNMTKLKPEQIVDELYKNQKIVVDATSEKPTLFRPPYGAYNKTLLEISDALGLNVVLWNVDPDDWQSPGVQSVVNRVLNHVKDGSVILMHEGKPNTLAALPQLIIKLKEKGYSFVTVSELLNYNKNIITENNENQKQQSDNTAITTP